MYTLTLIALVYVTCASCFTEQEYREAFTTWMQKHQKSYSTNEFQHRYEIFKNNMDYIQGWNVNNSSMKLGLNKMADLKNEEFQRLHLSKPITKTGLTQHTTVTTKRDLPASVDWRTKGAVTSVKNQAQCGSSYAFAAVGSIESANHIKTGNLVALSEQQIIDCSWSVGNQGCEGGLLVNTFEYVLLNGGIQSESTYPYDAVDDHCRFQASKVSATISLFSEVIFGSEPALQAAVAKTPVSAGIDSSNVAFQLYSGGIYDVEDCSTEQLDHAVLVVGYGTENGKDYWLAKNSFGENWGEGGYIKMARNKNNQCGIATMASYPNM